MTVTLAPGDLGIDMSGFRLDTTAKVNDFHKAGGKFTIRYSAGAASDPTNRNHASVAWKLITPVEHKHLISIGDLVANDEWYETRMTEGAAAGKADGYAAGKLWHTCGHAFGAAIYPSWDADPVKAKWPAADAYLKAYGAAIATWGFKLVGSYVGTQYMKHAIHAGLISRGWRPNAGSWSDDGLPYQPANPRLHLTLALAATPAHIWQTGNYWFKKQADENMILRANVGSHYDAVRAHSNPTPKPPAPKPPTPQPATAYYHDDGRGATALVSPDGSHAAFLGNDGKLVVRKYNPAVKHGVAERTI
jgi:hypothetical protein